MRQDESIRGIGANFVDDPGAMLKSAKLNDLLNDVGGKLVLRQLEDLATEELDHLVLVLRTAVLEDVLDDVVTILIYRQSKIRHHGAEPQWDGREHRASKRYTLHEGDDVEEELAHNLILGAKFAADRIIAVGHARLRVFENTLNDAAAIGVGGELVDLVVERVDDELRVGNRNGLNDLLDDVVAVLILDALHYVAFKLLDEARLLFAGDNLEGLLHDTATVHLQGEL